MCVFYVIIHECILGHLSVIIGELWERWWLDLAINLQFICVPNRGGRSLTDRWSTAVCYTTNVWVISIFIQTPNFRGLKAFEQTATIIHLIVSLNITRCWVCSLVMLYQFFTKEFFNCCLFALKKLNVCRLDSGEVIDLTIVENSTSFLK